VTVIDPHDIAVIALVAAAAALAGVFCGGWMLFSDQDSLSDRIRRLEEREADRIAEERATRRVPEWDEARE
jgi:hypothetical protein